MTQGTSAGSSFWTPGRILAALLAIVVLALAVANFEGVEISFLLFKVTLPLFVLIVGSLVIGYLVGWLSRQPGGER